MRKALAFVAVAVAGGFVLAMSASTAWTRAAVTPKGGLYKAHLGGTRYLEFSYIAHSHTAHIFMTVHMEGTRWISSRHYSGTKYVHDGKFDFTDYNRSTGHYLDVVGRWTHHEVVEGAVKEGHGVKESFRAHWIPPPRAAARTKAFAQPKQLPGSG